MNVYEVLGVWTDRGKLLGEEYYILCVVGE